MIKPLQTQAALAEQLAAFLGWQASHIHAAILRQKVARLIREAKDAGLHLTTGSDLANK